MLEDIQDFILKGLFEDREYFRNVVANLHSNHFDDGRSELVTMVKNYFAKYDSVPTYDVIANTLKKAREKFSPEQFELIVRNLKHCKSLKMADDAWLLDETKTFVKNKSVEELLFTGYDLLENNEKGETIESLYKDMVDLVGMSWDEDLGIEYDDQLQFDEVYDQLENVSKRIPTGIRSLDDAIEGGVETNTSALYVACGAAGAGKSLFLQNIAVNAVKAGRNVVYLTFELAENQIRKRMDSTFSGMDITKMIKMRHKVKETIKSMYDDGTVGKMFIKEYPTGTCTAFDIENYLNKLKLQKDFVPDIVMVDYLGIMRPMVTLTKGSNSYERTKIVCEELRSLSGKLKIPFFSASQLNRDGTGKDSVGMDNIADSMGIAHTADLVLALTQPDELKEDDKIRFEILKSRISKTGDVGIFSIDYTTLKIINDEDGEEKREEHLKEILHSQKEKKKIKGSGIK